MPDRSLFPLFLVALLMISSSACSVLGPNEADLTATALIEHTAEAIVQHNTQAAQASTATAQVRATEAQDGVRFLIVNHSSVAFCRIFISPVTSTDWENKDAHDVVIAAGSQGDVRVPAGDYDMRIDDCEGEFLVDAYEINIPEFTVWTLTDEDLAP